MGKIYAGTGLARTEVGPLDEKGEVTESGKVYSGTGLGREVVGSVESPHILFSGAALLLLLR